MTYQRKTKDEFQIHQCYSGQWEDVCSEDTRKEAKERLKEYRDNMPEYAARIVKVRVKLEQSK